MHDKERHFRSFYSPTVAGEESRGKTPEGNRRGDGTFILYGDSTGQMILRNSGPTIICGESRFVMFISVIIIRRIATPQT